MAGRSEGYLDRVCGHQQSLNGPLQPLHLALAAAAAAVIADWALMFPEGQASLDPQIQESLAGCWSGLKGPGGEKGAEWVVPGAVGDWIVGPTSHWLYEVWVGSCAWWEEYDGPRAGPGQEWVGRGANASGVG